MKRVKKSRRKLRIYILLIVLVVLVASGLLANHLIEQNRVIYSVETRVDTFKNYHSANEKVEKLGWLRVQGTNIDYPVIYNSADIEMADITEDFLWTESKFSVLPTKVFIVGHNLRNVSSQPLITNPSHTRFEQLMSYIYYDFVKDNKYIQFTIDGKDYLYKIFSVAIVEDDPLDYTSGNPTAEAQKEYIEQSLKDSYFDFDIEVDETDNIITLVTCTRFYGYTNDYTFKIDARLLREGDEAKNYAVKEKQNYEEIKEVLKGGENDEEA